jgi:group I intron endonuclease
MATIYSITSMKGDKVYIGSTTDYNDRQRCHLGNNNNCNSKIIIDEYGKDNCIFTILEECPVDQRYERERFHIDNNPNNVNGKRPVITIEEDKQRRNISNKEWKKNNPNKVKEIEERRYNKNREKRIQCQKEYYEANKDEINRKSKERYEANKAKKQSNAL